MKLVHAVTLLFVFLSTSVQAEEAAPTNAELYQLLLKQQAQIEKLESRALAAEAEADRLRTTYVAPTSLASNSDAESASAAVGRSAAYSYRVLDHAEGTNIKQRIQLEALQNGDLPNRVTIGGQVTALVNYQKANIDTKFGWLTRHPTPKNQIGKSVSEAVVHSANLNATAKLTDNLTAYFEMLYNPEQNFASDSTITGLPRNNVNMRKAYVMWGNLDNSPYYAAVGKMDIPFGWNDTVNPFSNSTSWHSFAGLAYGMNVGYLKDGLHVRAMAIQGGAQFRNANAPVKGSAVPSKLNNFAFDANYGFSVGDENQALIGASYQYGSSYCQEYPVKHFNPCEDNNPAVAIYGTYEAGKLLLQAEFATTTEDWPGTFNPINPALAEFGMEKSSAFTLGGRYSKDIGLSQPLDLSLEFSRFEAGAEGSPWEKQDQWVLGASYFVTPSVNIFGEIVHVDGWVPLNFLSGGNRDPQLTTPIPELHTAWSDPSSDTDVIVVGVQAAF